MNSLIILSSQTHSDNHQHVVKFAWTASVFHLFFHMYVHPVCSKITCTWSCRFLRNYQTYTQTHSRTQANVIRPTHNYSDRHYQSITWMVL